VTKAAKPKRKSKTCRCVSKVTLLLAKQNEQLCLTFRWNTKRDDLRALPTISTERLDPKKRTRRYVLVPSYCPFCGVAYPKETG
jgi:hypothetical protein